MHTKVYDFAAIGIGPFNLGLACLTQPIKELNGIFLDKRENFNWHPGMLIQDTTLQIPFLADLVTMADPTSPFSFLNYIKEQGRIYSFYIRENFLLLRNEYNQYCRWAVQKLRDIHFHTQVEYIDYDQSSNWYNIRTFNTQSGARNTIKTKKLVLGTGNVPYFPPCCKEYLGSLVHSASYLNNKKRLQSKKSITIVGSGQSAAEIFYDLLLDIDTYGYQLNWITRSERFFPLEYSKLTLEMTSPDYVDYFYQLPEKKRDQLIKKQKNLYKGINRDLIAAIYDMVYTKRLSSEINISLRTNSALDKILYDPIDGQYYLEFYQEEQERFFKCCSEEVILATGYTYKIPDFISGIAARIEWDEKGRFDVNRNYSIDKQGKEIFIQNAELHTHGFVTPDLGMGCYRNSYIIKEMTGKEHYSLERKIAFQQFSVNKEEEIVKNTPLFV